MCVIIMTDSLRDLLHPVLCGIVIALAFALSVITLSQHVMATNQTTIIGNPTDIRFLAIQNAKSGSITEINATVYTLELKNVSDSTILFSERPNRIVTSVSTSDFIDDWATGPDSFAADAPNDALIVEDTQTGNLETAVIESFNPVYDPTANTT